MSTEQTTEWYVVDRRTDHVILGMPWTLRRAGQYPIVDAFRTESAARYAACLLNAKLATVDPHAIVGCRVIAR